MKQLHRLVRAFGQDERGATAIIVALTMPVLAGMGALSVDMMVAYTAKEHLLTTAEAAAAAAVGTLPDRDFARSTALSYAKLNYKGAAPGEVVSTGEVQLGYWNKSTRTFTPKPDDQPANAVRVTASRLTSKGNPLPTFFGSVLGVSVFDVAVSVVALRYDGQPCINALAPQGIGVKVNSNAQIDTKNCPIHVHSAANDALSLDSNAKVAAEDICIKGSYWQKSNSSVSPSPNTSCAALAPDPYANIPAPNFGSICDYTNKIVDNKIATLSPGVYCGGLTIKGNSKVSLSSGEYIIKDGKFTIDSNSVVTGSEVGFYLTGTNALLEFKSNVELTLTAQSSGPRAGVLFFQDRNYSGQHEFNSNVKAVLDGALYFPNGMLNLNSNSNIDSPSSCLMIVAYRVNLDSNVTIESSSNVQGADSSLCPTPANTRKSRIVA